MFSSTLRKIHPQFALGIFLGLSVTFILHAGKSVEFIYTVHPAKSSAIGSQTDLRNAGTDFKGADGEHGYLNDSDAEIHKYLDDNSVDVNGQILFDDAHVHHEDNSVAQALYKQVRVLCWIMTSPTNLKKKGVHVKNTWGKRCNVLLFMSSEDDKDMPAIGLNVSEGRDHLTAKTMHAFSYIYDNHLDDAEWFMKADDDTYVILENLRYFLNDEDSDKPVYFGHKFNIFVKQGYTSGGGGYVLSKEALRRFGEKGRKDPKICKPDHGAEDLNMGRCMSKLDVVLKSSLDSLGRSRFHCFTPEAFIDKKYPKWYLAYDHQKGRANISDYAISFHYVSPIKMYHLEFYTYHLHPFGIVHRQQDLNVKS